MESEEFFCKIEVDPDPAADDEEDDNDTFVLQTFDPPPPSPPKEDAISTQLIPLNTCKKLLPIICILFFTIYVLFITGLSPLPPFQFHQPRNKGPPQPQACPICNKVFRGGHPKSRLRLHVDHVHGKVKPFPCPYCDFATTGKNMWVTHLLKKHETLEPSKPLACPHCPITFAISQLYSRHVENHTNLDFPHFCLNCDTRFQGRDQLDHHNRVSCPLLQQAKRIRQPLPCPVCEVTFFTEVKLSTHQRTQHPELLTFICPTCSSSHMAESHLTTHAQLHDDSLESYPCLVCRRVEFKLKDDLSLHLSSTHTGEETVPCDLAGCPIRFSSIATKLQHMGSTHKEAVWKCPTCQEGFTTLSARTTHEERAHKNQGVESFPCEEDGCGKILTSRLSLAGHVSRVHRRTGARMCEICGKQLTTVSSYKDHIKIHSGVKDWICEVCGRGFSCRKILKDHQVTHTGERPFKCKLCDKAYTQRQVLTSHVRKVHGGEGLKT